MCACVILLDTDIDINAEFVLDYVRIIFLCNFAKIYVSGLFLAYV